MKLQYDLAAGGVEKIRAALRGVEREIEASDRRLSRKAARPTRRNSIAKTIADPELDAAKRAALSRVQLEHKVFDAKARLTRKWVREEIRGSERAHARRLRQLERERATAVRTRKSMARGVARSTGNAITGTGRMVAGTATVLGGLVAGNAIRQDFMHRASAADLANQASLSGDKRSRQEIQTSVMEQANTLGMESGLGREPIIAALRAFQEISGDLAGAQEAIGGFSKIADASGADLELLGRAAGIFKQSLSAGGLKGEKLNDGLDEVLRSAVSLSAQGSIEMEGITRIAGKLSSLAGRSDGDPVQNIKDAIALSQVAVFGGASDAEEAGTAAVRFSDDLIQNQKRIKENLGVEVMTEDGGLREIRPLILEMLAATKGDITELTQKSGAKFGKRAIKGLEFLAKIQRGDKSGMSGEESAAGQAFLKGEASQGEIDEGATFRRAQADRQAARAFEELNIAVGERLAPLMVSDLIPALEKAIPTIVSVTEALTKLASFVIDNPLAGIGGIIAAKITADLTMAGIGKAAQMGLTALMSSMGIGTAGTAAAGAATSAAAQGAAVGGGSAAAGAAGAGALALGAAGLGAAAGVGLAAWQVSEAQDEGIQFADAFSGDSWNPLANISKGVEDRANQQAKNDAAERELMQMREQLAAAQAQQAALLERIDASIKEGNSAVRGNSETRTKPISTRG
jgi:hypothetical protein